MISEKAFLGKEGRSLRPQGALRQEVLDNIALMYSHVVCGA